MSTKDRKWSVVDVTRIGIAATLGGIGGAAGFKHTHDWAVENGQHGWLAWAVAVVIEGMAVVAGFEIQRDHRNGNHNRITFPIVVLVTAFAVQMASQVSQARDTLAGWLLAATPALGFLIVVKLLMRSPTGKVPAASTPTTPAPAEPATHTTVPEPVQEPVPVAPVESARVPRVKLPPAIVEKITTAISTARAQGREPTPADITAVVKLPDALIAQVLAEHATPVNGHTIP
ncbi:MAG: DUF2637 domain-containing protein [Actinomycetota bacterium]|nr:DUF2637 domain-containing protein [Actinomycetota bacterium]